MEHYDKIGKGSYSILFRYATIIFIVFICFPGDALFYISGGIDFSGIYAYNAMNKWGYTWGNDIIFTYGPLGFLSNCMNVGNNVAWFMFFWILCSLGVAYVLNKIFISEKFSKKIFFLSMGLLICGRISLEGGWAQYYICYIAILFMMYSKAYSSKAYIFTNILFCISFYIKTSSALMIFSSMVLFCIGEIFNRSEGKKEVIICTILAPIEVLLSYLIIYNHSLTGLIKYIKGCIEEASGYNYAMSMNISDAYGIWVVVVLVCYIIAMLFLFEKNNMDNFTILFIFLGPMYFCYKHGFVRSDHYFIAFSGLLILLSQIVLFINYDIIPELVGMRKKVFVSSIIFPFLIGGAFAGRGISDAFLMMRNYNISLPAKIQGVTHQDMRASYQLPSEMLYRIGTDTVTIYSWEISYAAFNEINYVPMPGGIQPYNMYTKYLDGMTSDFFENNNAPQWIVLSLETIDNRWPMLECPQTWFSIMNNYHVNYCENGVVLLKNNGISNEPELTFLRKDTVSESKIINLDGAGYICIDASLNTIGKLVNLFWKIPEVDMTVKYKDGHEEKHRVLLECLSGGVYVKSVAYNEDSFVNIVNGNGELSEVDSIMFDGEGMKYYKNSMSITLYETQYEERKVDCSDLYEAWNSTVDISEYEVVDSDIYYNIEKIDERDNYTQITGWAYKTPNMTDFDILIGCNGSTYNVSKIIREDVKSEYRLSDSEVGFSLTVPEKINDFSIYILNREENIAYQEVIY